MINYFKVPEGEYFIVYFDTNYADEFSVSGFQVLNRVEILAQAKIYRYLPKFLDVEMYFGTNESINIEKKEDCETFWDIRAILLGEYKVFKAFFPDGFGFILLPSDIKRKLDED